MKVILISGKIGSGKDTTANIIHRLLTEQGKKPVTRNLSFPLKKAVAFMRGEEEGLFYSRDHKGGELDFEDKRRRMLVDVGNAMGEIDPYVFSKFTFKELQHSCKESKNIAIISDLRLINELDFFEDRCDCYIIRLKGSFEPCSNPEVASSPSETELDYLDFLLKDDEDIKMIDSRCIIQLKCTDPKVDPSLSETQIINNRAFNVTLLQTAIDNSLFYFNS